MVNWKLPWTLSLAKFQFYPGNFQIYIGYFQFVWVEFAGASMNNEILILKSQNASIMDASKNLSWQSESYSGKFENYLGKIEYYPGELKIVLRNFFRVILNSTW